MTDFSYTLGIPNGPNDPSNDQPNMKINNDNISAIIGVDHVTFNQNNGGYHTDIHQIPLGGDPGAMSGIGQIYSKTLGSDQSLFYESGAGIITQLTGTNSSAFLQNTNGYIWIAGTILLQWGRKSFVGGGAAKQDVTINYIAEGNINMPNNTFVALATLRNANNTSSTAQISTSTRTSSGFVVHYTGSADYNEFQWFAVGF